MAFGYRLIRTEAKNVTVFVSENLSKFFRSMCGHELPAAIGQFLFNVTKARTFGVLALLFRESRIPFRSWHNEDRPIRIRNGRQPIQRIGDFVALHRKTIHRINMGPRIAN